MSRDGDLGRDGVTSREHARLKDAEEESGGEQARVVGDDALHNGGEAKEQHVEGEPDVGLELFHENVGGDLEQAVGDKEDDEGGVVLCAVGVVGVLEVEVLGEVKDFGVGNVDAIWGRLALRWHLEHWRMCRSARVA